jgi:DNA-binding MarR family transcriptional regulator
MNEDHTALRVWLRLLTCTRMIETQVRGRLRAEFETTLPRFDLMAQLYRHQDGLRMGELSHLMMVTGGNITGITDQLEKDGLVERVTPPDDRRAYRVQLTETGRATFEEMARVHERWVIDLMAGLSGEQQSALYDLLSALKQTLQEPIRR